MEVNPNEPADISIERKMDSATDVIADMKTASTETLLSTAQDIVAEKIGRSMILDRAAEERVPKFDLSDLTLGRVLGRGGFCVVQEAKIHGCGGSLASKPKGMIRRVFGREVKASSGRLSSTDSDWGDLDSSDAPAQLAIDLNGALAIRRKGKKRKYVMKRISIESLSKVTFLKATVDLAMETSFLASLEHPHLIRMYGVSTDGPFAEGYFIILERVNETLTKRIKKWMDVDRQCKGITGVFTGSKKKLQKMQSERIAAALDMATGTAYLHGKNIMFRDLKPDNIGYTSTGILKIFDFGLAKELLPKDKTEDGLYKLTGFTGAIRYMAPEVGMRHPYTTSADVYSWSMVLWYMLSLEPPFGTYTQKMFDARVFRRGYRPKIFTSWSPRIKEVICMAWHADPKQRPSFRDIIPTLRAELGEIDPSRAARRSSQGQLTDIAEANSK